MATATKCTDASVVFTYEAGATPPRIATPGSAGIDLFGRAGKYMWGTHVTRGDAEDVYIVSTGVKVAKMPHDRCMIIKDRSSLGARNVSVRAGVIDADYRDEIKVVVHAPRGAPFQKLQECIFEGRAIAQGVIVPVLSADAAVVPEGSVEPDESARTGGFGSTDAA